MSPEFIQGFFEAFKGTFGLMLPLTLSMPKTWLPTYVVADVLLFGTIQTTFLYYKFQSSYYQTFREKLKLPQRQEGKQDWRPMIFSYALAISLFFIPIPWIPLRGGLMGILFAVGNALLALNLTARKVPTTDS